MKLCPVSSYNIPDDIEQQYANAVEVYQNRRDLTEAEYIRIKRTSIYMDEKDCNEVYQKINSMHRDTFIHNNFNGGFFFITQSPELLELLERDECPKIIIRDDGNQVAISRVVEYRNQDMIFYPEAAIKFQPLRGYTIEFVYTRAAYVAQHFALTKFEDHALYGILIDNVRYHALPQPNRPISSNEYTGVLYDKLNKKQREAVASIINVDREVPLRIEGPPGTGKTLLISASIVQIVKTTDKNVLVCAMSNNAADELAIRISEELDQHQMLRLYSLSRPIGKVPGKLRRYANIRPDQEGIDNVYLPALVDLYGYRVIVVTLVSSTIFARICTQEGFSASHFGFVFCDESANAAETSCLIPIAGVCTSEGRVNTQIIIAGDTQQLKPIVCEETKRLGHDISYMERLSTKPIYKRNYITNEYNNQYTIMLTHQYRSHAAIMDVSNRVFYNGELVAAASPEITDWLLGIELLPNTRFPLLFSAVRGTEVNTNFSWSNRAEVDRVNKLIKHLLRTVLPAPKKPITIKDIVVLTPYRAQEALFKANLHRNTNISTIANFQGKESAIVILSTVRSGQTLGFLDDPRVSIPYFPINFENV